MKKTEFTFIKSPFENLDGKTSTIFQSKEKTKTIHLYKVIYLETEELEKQQFMISLQQILLVG